MAATFIFGADGLPKTPQEAARLRAIAQAMAPQGAPKNVGEGLTSLGNAIAYRMMMNKAAKGDAMGQNAASSAFSALMGSFGGGAAPASPSVSNATSAPSTGTTTPAPDKMVPNQPPVPGLDRASYNLFGEDGIDVAATEAYIRQSAQARGIDPDVAVRVARSEGLAPKTWQSNYVKNGKRETSYGPFQLLVGGGLGDKFQKIYGKSPEDPSTLQQQIDFALDEAAQGGWSPWYGAAKVGVGPRTGLEQARALGYNPPAGGNPMSAQPGMAATANIPMGGAPQEISVPGYVDPMVSAPNSRKPVAEALAKTQPLQPVQTAAGGGRQGIMAALMGGQPQTQDMPTDYFPAAPSAPGVSGPSPQQIMEVLRNPYSSPEEKAIAQDMYQQMQQSRDPMRQLEMQKMQLELQQMQNPQQVRVLTADEKKSLGLPVSGAFQVKRDGTIDQIGGGGVNITNEGTIPAGYRAVRDAEGRVMAIEPLPGSPAAAEAASVADKKDKATAVKETAANVVMQDIDRAFTAMDEAVLPTTGFVGDLLSNVGGTAANDIKALTQTVKANASFDKLQQMREASPTGGALGAVSDTELGLLSAAIGNLEQSQSGPQFRDNLARVYNIYADIIHGPGKGPQRKPLSFETNAPKPADTPPPAGMDKEIWDVMTPEERALWK